MKPALDRLHANHRSIRATQALHPTAAVGRSVVHGTVAATPRAAAAAVAAMRNFYIPPRPGPPASPRIFSCGRVAFGELPRSSRPHPAPTAAAAPAAAAVLEARHIH
ncbi:hypothetical protein PLESTB_000652600 [Pleodorina starrii]|uniref:Uncharacterized protein n=1 Tax=Pleodorina starrii TaxID=330485 RepID=A0A9W6BIW1_9CHLO|nr:hypothetical protein PLESTB_000652600 [Pleodorina starrii]GLC71651.1 hypothetical protein PLESTF_001145500 [Pleodorina starrii]